MPDAKNIRRIDVWPTEAVARAARDADGGKLTRKMTVWPTEAAARAHTHTGGGGGPSYIAKAVHFDGTAWLKANGALTGVVDSPLGLMSTWIKAADWFNTADGSDGLMFLGPDFNCEVEAGGLNIPQFVFYNLANTRSFSKQAVSPFSTTQWVNILAAWNMNFDGPDSKILQLYYSDLLISVGGEDASDAFSINYAGTDWQAGGATDNDPDGPGPIGDQADFQLWLGITADLTVEANRRLFIDGSGKPVDPAIAAGALGAPTIRFSGSAVSYATNLGTGGAFTLVGSLTDASSSPSD